MRQYSPGTGRARILLASVLLGSMILWVLPPSLLRPIRGLVQVLVPFQHAATAVSDTVTERESVAVGVRQAWEHRTAALSLRVRELEDEVRLLTATRLWEIDGASMRTSGRLIPARAVAGDILPWRDSMLLNSGRLQGVSQGAIVATDRFTIDRGEAIGLREGMAVLLGETLVGWVDELYAEASRVKCVSDPSVEMKVRIGRVTDTGFESVQEYFWLAGRGRGRMEIREVDHRLIEERAVEVGDLVVSDPASPLLAIPMVVGRVSEIGPNRENPLFSVVTVRTGLESAPLRRVYVFDPRGDDDQGR